MSVTRETVAKIASLARIRMGEDELDRMVPELNSILDWVEQLGEVDVSGVEPMTAVIPQQLRLRDDVVDAKSEEHTSELQSRENLVCRLLLEKKKFDKQPLRQYTN